METVILVCGYLFIAITVILLITVLKRVIKKEKPTARDRSVPVIILGVGFLYVIALVFRYSGEVGVSEQIQILLMFGLVAVTSFYAWSASRQADASVKMAEAMARPYLLLKLIGDYLQWDDIKGGQSAAREFAVTVFNAGGGPARNLSASLWKSNDIFPADTKGYLAPNQEWVANICKLSTDGVALGSDIPLPILKNKVKGNRPIVTVEYEDVHHTKWASYLYLEEVDDTNYVRDGEQNIVEL